jgi:predicted permease
VSLHGDEVGASGRALALLMCAVGLVLLVACVNVAQLVRVRSLSRARELAVRAAVGCGRARLVRQLMLESLMLGGAGAALGVVLARLGNEVWLALAASSLSRSVGEGANAVVLVFAALVGIATALAFGLGPAIRSSGFDLQRALHHEGGRGHSAGPGLSRSMRWLVATQLALTFVLIAGAGVLTKSFQRLAEVDLGIDAEQTLAFDVGLPQGRYPEPQQRADFYRSLPERIEALPGVRAAGAVSWLPAQGAYHDWGFALPTLGDGSFEGSPRGQANQRVVEGRFFEALRIPLLRGRLFDERDAAETPAVVVVSQELVRRFVPEGVDPLGQRLSIGDTEREIVGVVADTAIDPLGEVAPIVYHPHRQMAADRNWPLIQVVASPRGLEVLPALQAELRGLDPDLVFHRPRELAPLYAESISRERLLSGLLLAFAALAFALAGLGLFGVLSHSVGQRRRELGVRIALGATASAVSGLVVRQAAGVGAMGTLAGLVAALWANRWLDAFVFETHTQDPAMLVAAALGLLVLTLLASYLPARRASRVDPAEALRAE